MINIYHLQIFLSVVERGSFSSAAEELHLTQPAVSMQVRALEERYGVKLFSRVGQRVELTEAGRSLLEPARKLLSQALQVEENFSAGLGELRGRITIAYGRNTSVAIYSLPGTMALFRERYPNVQFSLQQMNEERVFNQVLEREVNFGVISGKPRQRGLELITLENDPLVLAVPLGHPWAGKTLHLHDLKGASFVLRSTGSETRRMGEMALRVAGLTYNDLQVVAEVDSSEAVAMAVEQGLGVGFISEIVVKRFLLGGKLATASLVSTQEEEARGLELEREVNLVRLAPGVERGLSPTQERFWEFLRSQNTKGKSENFHRD